jgi:hypothetical protein
MDIAGKRRQASHADGLGQVCNFAHLRGGRPKKVENSTFYNIKQLS